MLDDKTYYKAGQRTHRTNIGVWQAEQVTVIRTVFSFSLNHITKFVSGPVSYAEYPSIPLVF